MVLVGCFGICVRFRVLWFCWFDVEDDCFGGLCLVLYLGVECV